MRYVRYPLIWIVMGLMLSSFRVAITHVESDPESPSDARLSSTTKLLRHLEDHHGVKTATRRLGAWMDFKEPDLKPNMVNRGYCIAVAEKNETFYDFLIRYGLDKTEAKRVQTHYALEDATLAPGKRLYFTQPIWIPFSKTKLSTSVIQEAGHLIAAEKKNLEHYCAVQLAFEDANIKQALLENNRRPASAPTEVEFRKPKENALDQLKFWDRGN